jgi:hypothetical protein
VRRELEVDAVDDRVDRGHAHALGAHHGRVVARPDQQPPTRLTEPRADCAYQGQLTH